MFIKARGLSLGSHLLVPWSGNIFFELTLIVARWRVIASAIDLITFGSTATAKKMTTFPDDLCEMPGGVRVFGVVVIVQGYFGIPFVYHSIC